VPHFGLLSTIVSDCLLTQTNIRKKCAQKQTKKKKLNVKKITEKHWLFKGAPLTHESATKNG